MLEAMNCVPTCKQSALSFNGQGERSSIRKMVKKIVISFFSMKERLAESYILSFLSYFNEAEDYLNVARDPTVTFEQIVDFMARLRDAREINV